MITFEAKAVQYPEDDYSARVYEYHDGVLCAEIWLGSFPTEAEALNCARERVAEYWLFMTITGE